MARKEPLKSADREHRFINQQTHFLFMAIGEQSPIVGGSDLDFGPQKLVSEYFSLIKRGSNF